MGKEQQVAATMRAFLSENKISMSDAAARLGVSQQAVSNQLSGRKIGPNVARSWAEAFGFRVEYLLTGEGPALETEDLDIEHTVPLVPFAVRGGASLNDITEGVTDAQCERITSPVRGAEIAMEVVGDSMAPGFPAGARVLLRRVPADTFIAWGEVYVVETVNGPVLKRIMPTDVDTTWELRSDNPAYPPFRVRTEHVRSVWRVLLRMIQ